MQRLYVGGLSHSITEKDLKDRFGKFGDVQDVELRTRRDDEGVPYKTFSYININISDADLKKCLTVLNKSKWKGGTLQIEKAKESFLHRLAEERQTAAERSLQTPEVNDKRKKLLDSLSKAGVENFTMKAAVPGTEVPGHKDWVVSKFGRVLPILQLQCQKGSRARTLKYDPSKFSHNIRRLDRKDADVEQHTPIDQLTWELQGADSDISKKRRGEFPPYEPPKAKKRPTHMVHSNSAADRTRSEPTINQTETRPFTNGFDPSTNRDRRPARRWPPSNDSDVDSDEEIRRLVAAQDNSHNAVWQQEEEDHLEVVGLDYLVTPGRSHQQQKGRTDDEDENGYDSADTDELFASRKPPLPPAAASSEEKQSVVAAKKLSGTNIDRKMTKSKDVKEEEKPGNHGKQSSQKQDSSSEEDDDEDDEESESDDSCSDSDYDGMFSNITYLQISLADLQKVAEESQQDPETTTPSILGSKQETNIKVTSERPAPKKGITPEDILASIMGDDNSDDDKKKKKRKGATSAALPAFQGTKCLDAMSEMKKQEEEKKEEVEEGRRSAAKRQKLDSESLQTAENRNKKKEEETSGSSEEEEEDVASLKDETSSSLSSDDDEEDEDEVERIKTSSSQKVSSSASIEKDEDKKEIISAKVVSSTPSPSESSTSEEDEEEEEQEEQQPPPRVSLRPEEEEQRQKEANRRRLAAIQQRIKDAEEHKKLIQGALSKVDAPTTGAGKHIVFGSDDEEEEPTSEVTTQKKTLLQDSQSEEEDTGDEMSANEKVCGKTSGPRLFGGSDDDDDDEDSNEDVSRFDIRPQFEGRAGQKLMELQSRFGTDERFRMDSRFLEDDKGEDEESERKKSLTEEDEDLEEERKKNLSILQTILGSGEQIGSNKTAGKAKTFRDVSALHYDPSKEEHAAFETKTEETKKESKAARRKKREEAEKLPEVSKEIYYDVSGDLKAVFGLTKDNVAERKEKASWDQEEEEEGGGKDEEPSLMSSLALADPNTEKQEPSGFTFSFFGDDTVTESKETAEYKVETIQAPKVSWQQDPRFQDSSSEEEDEDEEEQEKDEEQQSSTTTKTTEQERPSQIDLFFFFPDDSRLTEGPRLFCRSSQLEKQREQWEERRTALRQEYRKKHKDARRKLKSSLKS